VKGVRSFHAWLRSQLAEGKSWADISRAVLLAQGDVVASPQIGYYTTVIGEKGRVEESELPDSVAQSFLGTRIGCARCHNHPLERYTQDDFYHFAAFFGKVSLDRKKPESGITVLSLQTKEERESAKRLDEQQRKLAELEAPEFAASGKVACEELAKQIAEQRKRAAEAEKQLAEMAAKPPVAIQPRTNARLAPRTLDHTEPPTEGDTRERFVEWMLASEQFSGAMVNRMWKHYFGTGLVEPVDDLRASNPPSNGELWTLLNAEFRRANFDLRAVMRLILTSRAYALASTTLPGNAAETRYYSHYYARRLPAEVLTDAIASATAVPTKYEGYPLGLRAIQLPDPQVGSYFLSLFGRSERVTACACERRGEVTLPQLLHLRNGDEMQRQITAADGRLAALLKTGSEREAADALFAATGATPCDGSRVRRRQCATRDRRTGSAHGGLRRCLLGAAQRQGIRLQSLTMLDISLTTHRSRFCSGVSRRDFLRIGALTPVGLSLSQLLAAQPRNARAKSVILVYLGGGISHHDSFDPKPEAVEEIRGKYKSIPTNVPGLHVTELLPEMAKVMDKVALVRGGSHENDHHETATNWVLSGRFGSAFGDHPAIGAVVAHETGFQGVVPPYVAVPKNPSFTWELGRSVWLGGRCESFKCGNPNDKEFRVRDLSQPANVTPQMLERRRSLLGAVDTLQAHVEANDQIATYDEFSQKAAQMVLSPEAQAAFDIGKETEALRDEYGRTDFGQSLLMARRLAEAGVRFVTVNYSGWDHHEKNLREPRQKAARVRQIVRPIHPRHGRARHAEGHTRRLLRRVWTHAEGQQKGGRDHWGRAGSMLFAGAGVVGGKVIGSTDKNGAYVTDRPVRPADVAWTIYDALGIDANRELMTPEGRPTHILTEGAPVRELYA
jgi:hypothetical protein